MRLPPGSDSIVRTLRGAGYECYLVGGSVRDLLLGRRGVDMDFTTNARPPELQRLFPRSHYENRFGTVLVRAGGKYHEVTTYRGEGRYSDHRHPDEIRFVDRLEEDLQRRDFTINAMAMDEDGRLVDPFGGRGDLDARLLRAVGDPAERLSEDPLRMMRAVRLAVQLDFTIEPHTAEAIRRDCPLLAVISRERVRDELLKILASERPTAGIELLGNLGLLSDVLPGLAATRTPQVTPAATGYNHALQTLAHCQCDALLRLAALLHVLDEPQRLLPALFPSGEGTAPAPSVGARFIAPASHTEVQTAGDPFTRAGEGRGEGETRAAAEPRAAPSLARELARLRLSNAEADRERRLVAALPLLPRDLPANERSARRLLSALGELFPDVLRLAEAHRRAGAPQSANLRRLGDLRRLAARVEREHQPFTLAGLALNGDDLVHELGIPPGPHIGELLKQLLDRVLDDPSLNEREMLLAIARAQ